jgi:glycosyltransferase involved in cell wall biosynthesis
LVVGDNRPRKNLGVLTRAWSGLGDAGLHLVSAGPALRRWPGLAELARRDGARDAVGLGWVSEPELNWLYSHAEMVLLPAYTRVSDFR